MGKVFNFPPKKAEKVRHYYGSAKVTRFSLFLSRETDQNVAKLFKDRLPDVKIEKQGNLSREQWLKRIAKDNYLDLKEKDQLFAANSLFDLMVERGAIIENGHALKTMVPEAGYSPNDRLLRGFESVSKVKTSEGIKDGSKVLRSVINDLCQEDNDKKSIESFRLFVYKFSGFKGSIEDVPLNNPEWLENNLSEDAYAVIAGHLPKDRVLNPQAKQIFELTCELLKTNTPLGVYKYLNEHYRKRASNDNSRRRVPIDVREKPNHQKAQRFSRKDLWAIIDRAKSFNSKK